MAPVVKAPQADARMCVTALHREMLDSVLDLFAIAPNHDLDLMQPGQRLFEVTSGALLGLRRVLEEIAPDLVLVHGGTTTIMAASLAAYSAHTGRPCRGGFAHRQYSLPLARRD